MTRRSMTRTRAIPLVVCILGLLAALGIVALQQRAASDRAVQLDLAALRTELSAMQTLPVRGMVVVGGSPIRARTELQRQMRDADRRLTRLDGRVRVPGLDEAKQPLQANFSTLWLLARLRERQLDFAGRAAVAARLLAMAADQRAVADAALGRVDRRLDARATQADHLATGGAVGAVLMLLAVFGYVYRRSLRARSLAEALAHENARLARVSRREARTDALTGLGNRRALVDDLEAAAQRTQAGHGLLVALFDLDGFKRYNDTFGHPAGDALLARLGRRLQLGIAGAGTAYRMGGDEFCVLLPDGPRADALVRDAAAALSDAGDGFSVDCSYGLAVIPGDAVDAVDALRLADRRMYEDKAAGARDQATGPAGWSSRAGA